jgi:hypothetical protein
LLLKNDPMRLVLNSNTGLVCLFCLVFLSRLPFLDAGYGMNPDAWRVARVARDLALTGEYNVSRFPGYPVQEIICSLFWRGGPAALNGLSALFSAIAAVAFAVIARRLGCRDWFLAGLALAATPIFFVSSVCSKDYVWALAFALLSFLSALDGRPGTAGILLGIATGCRLTSAAMFLPISLLIWNRTPRTSLATAKFAIAAMIVAFLAFTPVWLHYGMSFLTFYSDHPRPGWDAIFARSTVEVWGSLGLVALGVASLGAWVSPKQPNLTNRRVVTALLLLVAIYAVAYLRLPDQAGYLLPIVPAVLLLFSLITPPRVLQIAFGCLLLAALVEPLPTGFHSGAILADHQQRLASLAAMRDFLNVTESVPGKNVFVVGASEPEIAVLAPRLQNGRNHYVYQINASEVKAALEDGRSLFYLPTMRRFNYMVTGTDLAQFGARDVECLFHRAEPAVDP